MRTWHIDLVKHKNDLLVIIISEGNSFTGLHLLSYKWNFPDLNDTIIIHSSEESWEEAQVEVHPEVAHRLPLPPHATPLHPPSLCPLNIPLFNSQLSLAEVFLGVSAARL